MTSRNRDLGPQTSAILKIDSKICRVSVYLQEADSSYVGSYRELNFRKLRHLSRSEWEENWVEQSMHVS
jgi:hypothetical protein